MPNTITEISPNTSILHDKYIQIALFLTACFTIIAVLVSTDLVDTLDIKITSSFANFHLDWLDSTLRFFTYIGNFEGIVIVTALACGFMYTAGHKFKAKLFLAIVVSSQIINPILKLIFGRDRPSIFDKVTIPDSLSFPSGHSFSAAAVYGFMLFLFARMTRRFSLPLTIAGFIVPLTIGFSRVYLGAHWASDVAGGLLLGYALCFTGLYLLEKE